MSSLIEGKWNHAVTSSMDRTIKVWDLTTMVEDVFPLTRHQNQILDLLPAGDLWEANHVDFGPGGGQMGRWSHHVLEELVSFFKLLGRLLQSLPQAVLVEDPILWIALYFDLKEGARVSVCQHLVELVLLLSKVEEKPCQVVSHLIVGQVPTALVKHLVDLPGQILGVLALFFVVKKMKAWPHRF